jgi:hypothetical protein
MANPVKFGLGLIAVNLILIVGPTLFNLAMLLTGPGVISDFSLHWMGGSAPSGAGRRPIPERSRGRRRN